MAQKKVGFPKRMLTVRNFSAISDVSIEFRDITILTGPQASGKSLLCKLIYFFQDLPSEMFRCLTEGSDYTEFKQKLSSRFEEWFPSGAWGEGRFEIIFETEKFDVRVARAGARSKKRTEVVFSFSEDIGSFYDDMHRLFRKIDEDRPGHDSAFIRAEFNWRARSDFYSALQEKFANSLAGSQTYIPASRAFFTTFGKTMSAFEHGQLLDPITKAFGQLYVVLIDRMRHGFPISYRLGASGKASDPHYRHTKLADVFGGKPKMERNVMVIEAPDGRIIPLFALSSGQQELLPLWIALDYFESTVRYVSDMSGPDFLYIEEPEAHLFPAAQTAIVDVLSSLISMSKSTGKMVLTTHSPYILSKINNLLLAGSMGYRKRLTRQAKVSKVIPKSLWLLSKNVSCYGLDDGRSINIMDESGMISTDYIDSVSEDVIDEFSRLLDLEC